MAILPEDDAELLRIVILVFRKLLQSLKENTNLPPGGLLDKADVMRILHVSRTTLYEWKVSGLLVPCRIGRRDYYRAEDLKRFR